MVFGTTSAEADAEVQTSSEDGIEKVNVKYKNPPAAGSLSLVFDFERTRKRNKIEV